MLNVPVHRRLGHSASSDRAWSRVVSSLMPLAISMACFLQAAFGQQAGRFMGGFIPRRLIRQLPERLLRDFHFTRLGGIGGHAASGLSFSVRSFILDAASSRSFKVSSDSLRAAAGMARIQIGFVKAVG